MTLREIVTGISGLNLFGVSLALRKSSEFRPYLSECVRRYDEYIGNGLPPRDPIAWLCEHNGCKVELSDRIQLPPRLMDGGGTSLSELLILAAVTRILQPKKVFEIGTFNGRTTSTFILNAALDANVFSLDLPPDASSDPEGKVADAMIDSDVDLVKHRKLARFVYELKLESHFQQLLGDSMKFDPAPHRESVDLGFVDGAHALAFVKNDTEKMAVMMKPNGIVLWHDYGGRGRFGPLTDYLEGLGRQIPVYRCATTTLAWAAAADLKKLI